MLTKRLIACFDVIDDKVTKAVRFQDNREVAKADQLAETVYKEGIDELIFYDILASSQKRSIALKTVQQVAQRVFVPFTVGGGIKTLQDMYAVLDAGAEKVSVDSMAIRDPRIISQGAQAFGSQCIVLSTQVKRVKKSTKIPSGYEVYIDGARTATGLDALAWLSTAQELGAGEVCLNSIDNDGMLTGYDLDLMKAAEEVVSVPLIVSGGAGRPQHLSDLFTQTEAQAAIISSMLYSPRLTHTYRVSELKEYLLQHDVAVRPPLTVNL